MNAHKTKPKTAFKSLTDLDIVSPELSHKLISQASAGSSSIRESFIYRYSHSRAEYAAACELAETLGLMLH